MAGFRLAGLTGLLADVLVDALTVNRLQVQLPTVASADTPAMRLFSENDAGDALNTPLLVSPETTDDYKFRVTQERLLDLEVFNYAAQNTSKHTYSTSASLTITWTAAGLTTNGGSITSINSGATFGTYAEFPAAMGAHTLYCEFIAAINVSAVATNTTIDCGMFRRGASTAYAPTDGAYFELTSSGIFGAVIYNSGTPVLTSAFAFTPTPNTKYKFIIAANERRVEFWIDDVLYGTIDTPAGQGQPWLSASLPFSVRHAIGGVAASSSTQMVVSAYTVSQDSPSLAITPSQMGNMILGAYQGLSGGTVGSLANYANNTNPTPAVAANTTAALGTGLGGQFWETDTLAVTTDGIICSYQVPAGTVAVQGRRLAIYGVKIDTYVQTSLTGGGYNEQWSLAFGHTSVSLATSETATTKAPRRIPVGSRTVASGAVALTQLPTIAFDFTQPVYVNPGEFVALAKKKVGTAPSAGVMGHVIAFDYGWE
jgi:hypothetical protein